MKKDIYDYVLYVKGLYGRNRKVKFDSFEIVRNSESVLDTEQVIEQAQELLKTKIKPKGEFWYKITEQKCQLENDSGIEIKTFMLFSGTKTLKEDRATWLKK